MGVIVELWAGIGGFNGGSFSIYSPETRKWRQTWVDNSGTLLLLEGHYRDEAMRLTGLDTSPSRRNLNRFTWTTRPDGTVRQLWEASAEDGKSWQVMFDGLYRKKQAPGQATPATCDAYEYKPLDFWVGE